MVLSSLVYAVGSQVLFLVPWALREATWMPDGVWILTLVSGKRVESRLLPSTLVTPRLLVLNFRRGWLWSRAMVLLPDSLDAELQRHLRMRLRLFGGGDGPGTDALA